MSVSANTACITCKNSNVSEPRDECGLCRSWQHKSCINIFPYANSKIKYIRTIDLWVCNSCYSNQSRISRLNSTIMNSYEDDKILMLRVLRKQLQEANNILLSGNKALYEGIDDLRKEMKEMSSAPLLQKINDTLQEGNTVRPAAVHGVSQEDNNIEEKIGECTTTQNKLAETQRVQNSLLEECAVSLNKIVAAQQLQNQRQNELLAESVATQKKLLQALEMLQTPPPQDAANTRVAQIEQAIMKMQEQFSYLLGNLKGE